MKTKFSSSNNESEQRSSSSSILPTIQNQDIFVLKQVPNQLHSAQQEINNLRLLNVCLQSTLIRVQTQLIEYLPENTHDEIKRNNIKQKLAQLRRSDDHIRRIIPTQQISFFRFFDQFSNPSNTKSSYVKHISLTKNERQIDNLHEMFHELHTIIHTEHNDRICQLYITLAQTSQSVIQTRDGKSNIFLDKKK
ncbi:hypothetical protein I4U23_030380 [Adineta vaga]|nr:hypothetical protein I4U23_030380 [Adineta vaga]